jgi:hypothetical protein
MGVFSVARSCPAGDGCSAEAAPALGKYKPYADIASIANVIAPVFRMDEILLR